MANHETFPFRDIRHFQELNERKKRNTFFLLRLNRGVVSICPCAFSHITAGRNPLFLLLPFLLPLS